MSSAPIPAVPWQLTGNHWVALPCIHPADGSVHALGILHRASRAAVEFAGGPDFLAGGSAPLARPTIAIDGVPRPLADASLVWERGVHWLPTWTATLGDVIARATVFAPFGRDADTAGAVYTVVIENRGDSPHRVEVALDGALGHRQARVRTPSPFVDAHRVLAADDAVVLEGVGLPSIAAIAIGADADASIQVSSGPVPTFVVRRAFDVAPGEHADVAFFLAVGPERDGARATLDVLRRRGWRDLLGTTRDALRALEQTTGSDGIDRVINRNLMLAYFFAVGRALDDAQYYLVRTRAPWHSQGVTVREWEALQWTLPAVRLADTHLARELLLRACELFGYAPGAGTRYLDGALFEPGFSLEGAAAYAIAVDHYLRDTADDELVDEPVLADTLYVSLEDIAARRHAELPLYRTEVTPDGAPARLPYTTHGNAVVAYALDALRRTLDEETARRVADPEAVRAALRRGLVRDRNGKAVFVAASDLAGTAEDGDQPAASLLWLPHYELVDRTDSTYRRTARSVAPPGASLAQVCARTLGPDGGTALGWLRRAPLDGGFAAEQIAPDGRATANGADASLAGLLAHTLWYAVHVLGVLP